MSARYGGWIYVFCFSLISGCAQQNGVAGQSAPPASLPPGGASRHMTLDVVVTDKSGRPVSGLQERDFTLLDNKQPRKIASFHAVEGTTATADPPVQVILLMDGINALFTNVAIERGEIEKFLRRNGGALAQPVSIVILSDTTASGTTPSRDVNAVIAELNQKQIGLRTIGRAQGVHGGDERIRLSVNALKQLAEYEAATPGLKLAIWISPGWPFLTSGLDQEMASKRQRQELFDSIVAVSDALRQARITLYSVDPLGTAAAGDLRTSDYEQFLKAVKTAKQAEIGHLALQVLAYQSGGRVLNSSNDLAGEIGTCVADANAFYVLSFDGLAGDGPNEYHALEIKIDKPGLTARTRSGYYAQPEHQH
jgi:VWFA-related protein